MIRSQAVFLDESLHSGRDFLAVIFQEAEVWRASESLSPSKFATERLGVTPRAYLEWIQRGAIGQMLGSERLFHIMDRLLERRCAIADGLGLVDVNTSPTGTPSTVDSAGNPVDVLRCSTCPACGRNALWTDIPRRIVYHTGPDTSCPFNDGRTKYDLLAFGDRLKEVKERVKQDG